MSGIWIDTSQLTILHVTRRKELFLITCHVSRWHVFGPYREHLLLICCKTPPKCLLCGKLLALPTLQRGNTHRDGGEPWFPTRSFDWPWTWSPWQMKKGAWNHLFHSSGLGGSGGQVPSSSYMRAIVVYLLSYSISSVYLKSQVCMNFWAGARGWGSGMKTLTFDDLLSGCALKPDFGWLNEAMF